MADGWVSQIRKGVVEVAVLGLLAGEPRYGSQLVDDLAAHPALAITPGTVYPLLARLRKGGVVVSWWRVSGVGRRGLFFWVSGVGREVLADMAATWRSVDAAITTILKDPS